MNDEINGKLEKVLRKVLKPARYTGGEYGQTIKDKAKMSARFAFCFPDTYEIGMSNLGMRILYNAINQMEDVWCERVYSPWVDMEAEMRKNDITLYALESGDPVKDFDFMGITLQYELCYTNVLNMLELAGLPLKSCDRDDSCPIVVGGGPCTYNAEPIADFFDVFSIGEGEQALCEMVRLYIDMKASGSYSKDKFLRELSHIEGFYVPSLYDVTYNSDGTIKEYAPRYPDVPRTVKKRIIKDLDKAPYPEKFVMPYIETVHDRITEEVYRGCIRGCRFCQAGMIYRPIREKSPDKVNEQVRCLYEVTGYDEVSLLSLSISDYKHLSELTEKLLEWTDVERVGLSLPSLRADTFSKELMERISSVRQSGLTFAPEAGSARLRDAINKNITEDEILNACGLAFEGGKTNVKLYFMMGLPTETYEDIAGIPELARHVVDRFYQTPFRPKGKSPQVTISCACFIPKPFTAFQWDAQDSLEELDKKQKFLREKISDKKIRFNYHDAYASRIEAALARGDRRLCEVMLEAHKLGLTFDAWDEYFSYEKWCKAFENAGVDMAFYANRAFGLDEVLPWDMIDIGVTKEFLLREYKKSRESVSTPNCREKCAGCGANRLGGATAWCPKISE